MISAVTCWTNSGAFARPTLIDSTVVVARAGTGIDARPPRAAEPAEYDLTADRRAFVAAIRARIFQVLKAWSRGDAAAMNAALDVPDRVDPRVEPWTSERVKTTPRPWKWIDFTVAEHGAVRFDPEARNARHTYIAGEDDRHTWRVQQMLVDAQMVNDWVAEFEVDLAASRLRQQPAIWMTGIRPLQ